MISFPGLKKGFRNGTDQTQVGLGLTFYSHHNNLIFVHLQTQQFKEIIFSDLDFMAFIPKKCTFKSVVSLKFC